MFSPVRAMKIKNDKILNFISNKNLKKFTNLSGDRDKSTDSYFCTHSFALSKKRVFYRPDKERRPITRLPLQKITEKMGWSDDPEDEGKYNRIVELPYLYSHEKLWRNDDLYNIIVELGYNDKPPIRGRGSAIFMHLMAKDGSSTAGCISLRKNDLLQLISMIEINEALEIKA
mgnify:CR=1 FL=1